MFSQKSRRLRRNLTKFRKKSVDVAKFVKDFYVDNGLAYIACNVEEYGDIIDRYSVEGYEWLSESFARFVEENANYVPPEYPIVLEICGCRFRRAQRECIEATIADYYALKLGDVQMSLEGNRRKTLFLLGMGLFFAVVVYMVSMFPSLPRPILEAPFVLFWFCLWDAAETVVIERRDLVEEKLAAAQLASVKVAFREAFEDIPATPEEEEKILEEIFEEDVLIPSTQWE